MSFFLGLSHSQISEKSGLPLGTVKSRIRVAFQKLKETLEDDGVTEVSD
jgi:RNA polymerase sigma-70 factor (ECF subfamily)